MSDGRIGRWIAVLPCIHFTVKEREIIRKYGFMTFPEFVDNHYVKNKRAQVSYLVKCIEKYDVKFAIAPDYQYDNALLLKRQYPDIEWIFPLHMKEEKEIAEEFDWVGFPHREHFRDYSLEWFLENFEHKKRWYLGFWKESNPFILFNFHGFDTTLPETYSGKFGKIWISWNKSVKAIGMKTIEIFETNVRNFKKEIEKLSEGGEII